MVVTFLREEDIWGNDALEVIQAYGTAVGISDVAIALGTMMGSGTKNSAGVASGLAWSMSSYEYEDVRTVNSHGDKNCDNPSERRVAGCPALPFSTTSKIRPDNVGAMRLANGKAVQICEYGAYPQTVAPKSVSQELEARYQKNALGGRLFAWEEWPMEPPFCFAPSYGGREAASSGTASSRRKDIQPQEKGAM